MGNDNHILITGCTVVSMDDALPRHFRGAVGISGNLISMVAAEGSPDIGRFGQRAEEGHLIEIDGTGMIAMPGLINTHNHVAMTLMRGYADDMPLMRWLTEKIWPFEELMTREDIKAGARLGIAEMLLGGTTCFVDMYRSEEAVAEAVVESGIRAVLTSAVTDSWMPVFEKDIRDISAKYGLQGNDMLRFMLAPHAPYTNSEQTLLKVRELSRELGLGINIHVAETRDEINIIKERYGKTPVEFLDGLGLIGPDTLMVHCVWLTDNDIDIIARRGASVAHCPQSNMKLASGISPVSEMMRAGINVSLGTDGASSNNDLDMWEEMRSASFLQKVGGDPTALPACETLGMATAAGAKAIGMEGRLGVIRPGALADIILVNTSEPHMNPIHDPVANLAYCARGGDVDTVVIDGRIVVRHGELLTMQKEALCRETQQSADNIVSRLKASTQP